MYNIKGRIKELANMKKYMSIVIALITMIFLVACEDSEIIDDAHLDIKELVHEYTIGEFDPNNISASINSHQLVVQEADEEKIYDLPEDEFFVSIAPFISETHECAIHSLTSCQGELVEETFHVTVKAEEGDAIVDEEMKTFANGFIDLWLPRDEYLTVTIEQDGEVAESNISTLEGDDTCTTTMQLKNKS